MDGEDFVVAMIFSNWTLSKILNFFEDYLECEKTDIGTSKIERFKDRRTGEFRDSNRTLILLKKSFYHKALAAGLDLPQPNLDFRISEYMLKDKNFPEKNYSSNLYIIIPKQVDYQECENIIREKLSEFVKFGMLANDDYSLTIPLASRMTGEHRGFASIKFTANVGIKTRALIKVLLHDCFIHITSIDKLYHLPVFWSKETKVRENFPKIIKILKKE